MMNNQDYIIIGERPGWGEPQRFGISAVDHRQHIYIIGKTGSGKTTLLRNLILQHIALGHGVGLIDPHGDLAEELLHHIPPRRADHLVYFNPGDLEFPIGLNLLANVAPDSRHLVASGMGSTMSAAQEEMIRDNTSPGNRIILMLDEDEAGREARDEIASRLAKSCFVRVHRFDNEGGQA